MHGPAHADRTLELATSASDRAAVLGMHIGREKWPLHELNIANGFCRGNVYLPKTAPLPELVPARPDAPPREGGTSDSDLEVSEHETIVTAIQQPTNAHSPMLPMQQTLAPPLTETSA